MDGVRSGEVVAARANHRKQIDPREAAKAKQVEPVAQGLDDVTALMAESKDLSTVLADVRVTRAVKQAVMQGVVEKAQLPELVSTFVLFVMDKRRLALLPEISRLYHRLADERRLVVHNVELGLRRQGQPDLLDRPMDSEGHLNGGG